MKTLSPILCFLLSAGAALAQAGPEPAAPDTAPSSAPAETPGSTAAEPAVRLEDYVVSEQLDQARDIIMPSLGASTFTIDRSQIDLEPLGDNAPFSQVILRAPGVAQDSAANGDLHVRGEHGNLQYRINNVLLPEGLSGFGLELDPRFVGSLQLITGSLPAQYGFRTAGIVDIKTKSGSFDQGSEVELYSGSFDTVRTSVETSGSDGPLSYFVDASYDHNGLGIENPTPSATAVHDATDQGKAFSYVSYVLDPTSRLSFMASASYSNFQVPDTPGLPAGTSPDGDHWLPGSFDSTQLDEHQNEQNYYGVAAYEKSAGDLSLQVAGYVRASGAHFYPDPTGDLFFNGVASEVNRRISSVGVQADGGDRAGDAHTLRAGFMALAEQLRADTTTTVFPVDGNGDPIGPAYPIIENGRQHATFLGAYLQDEWKLGAGLTLNYGARVDAYRSSFDHEGQISPRVNLIYQATPSTEIHAGYARYFTPPPLEYVSSADVALFDGTSNASTIQEDDPVRSERSHYFDVGVTRKVGPGFQAGLDTYYKSAHNQLDDGLFGQSLILSAFNYREGRVYGAELTTSYTSGGFSAYGNFARSNAQGQDWNSAQFQFDPADLAYVHDHWIHLDHDQRFSGSFGASYEWKDVRGATQVYVDTVYGSGLRDDATNSLGQRIPNGGSVPSYYTVSAGVERSLKLGAGKTVKLRLDVVNLTDEQYELRDGSGVGVNAAQYGMRRGVFGTVGFSF